MLKEMGETFVRFKIWGGDGRAAEVEAPADTGATFSKIPERLAEELRLEIVDQVEVEIGDRKAVRKLARAEAELEGIKRTIYLTIGKEGERPLLGYTALEVFGFKVNPLTGRLERALPVE